ncbi:hypothetical protein [Devosia naphthalenivorans]|uniref:hypothetical protein n=1 Tax=Devosia naphthalenivorans TaxID=2082392 RepID=UPI0019627ADB|nr:hypothetical protein [Devosia naphthalenivorans]
MLSRDDANTAACALTLHASTNGKTPIACWHDIICPWIFLEQGLKAGALRWEASASTHSSWLAIVQKWPLATALAMAGPGTATNPNSIAMSSRNLFMNRF